MSLPTLNIAGIPITAEAGPVNQGYRTLEGATVHRMLDGTGVKQTHWTKLATDIRGDGWIPLPLAGVDWAVPVEILCVQPRSLYSATTSATLPAARRTDLSVNVFASAVVGGLLVPTPVGVVGNVAAATAVPGATGYQFAYYPKITCHSSGPTLNLDLNGAVYGWTLTAEEA